MAYALAVFFAMCADGRMHGIGLDDDAPLWERIIAAPFRILSTAIMGICSALASIALYGVFGFAGGALSAWAICWGHGNFYGMKGSNPLGNGPEKIETRFARPIWLKLGGDIYTPAYSWWCMGLKWLAMGLGFGPWGWTLAIFAPAAYTVSMYRFKTSALAEWLTTIYAGMLMAHILLTHPLGGSLWNTISSHF